MHRAAGKISSYRLIGFVRVGNRSQLLGPALVRRRCLNVEMDVHMMAVQEIKSPLQ